MVIETGPHFSMSGSSFLMQYIRVRYPVIETQRLAVARNFKLKDGAS